jgi:hypothetical protein
LEADMAEGSTWRNRIVGHGEEAPADLVTNPRNFRIHPKTQRDAMTGVLGELGWIDEIIVNRRSGCVINGHMRVAVAIGHDEPSVPVKYVELDDDEEALALATFDPLGALATTNAAQLSALLATVVSTDDALRVMLADLAQRDGMASDVGAAAEDPGAQIDRAEELRQKWGTERGQLWEIGRHRLLCGDSTSADDVARLMAGERATAVVTDSPYGIDREGITNDSPEGLRALFDGALRTMPTDDAVVLNFQSPRLAPVWIDALREAGHKFERMLWMYDENDQTKPWRGWLMCSQAIVVSSTGAPAWGDGKAHHDTYVIGLSRDWRAGGAANDFAHASVKPSGLVADLLGHTTGLAYDPFSGSGTTLAAAEQTGRICYGIEIEPSYIAVTLERLDGMGLTPRLVG